MGASKWREGKRRRRNRRRRRRVRWSRKEDGQSEVEGDATVKLLPIRAPYVFVRSNWKRKAFLVAMGTAMTALMILLGLDQVHEISEPTRQTLSTQRVSTPPYSLQAPPHSDSKIAHVLSQTSYHFDLLLMLSQLFAADNVAMNGGTSGIAASVCSCCD